MRILVVSDFHGSIEASRKAASKAEQIHADVAVIAGDVTHFGSVQNAKELLLSLVELKLPVFFVPGNCDSPSLATINLKGARCIHGSCETYDNGMFVGVGGCPNTPFNTPFEMTEDEIMNVLNRSFEQVQLKSWLIMVSHTPPKDTKLDAAFIGEHVGSSSVRQYIEDKQPSIVFCGHIHEARGIDHIGNTVIVNPGPARHSQCAIADLDEKIEVYLDHF
ncbi:MAG: metallophosphoesterase family protein [Candidatus Bathyarchaeota archaeon]|jgi:putative phosphoesterase